MLNLSGKMLHYEGNLLNSSMCYRLNYYMLHYPGVDIFNSFIIFTVY